MPRWSRRGVLRRVVLVGGVGLVAATCDVEPAFSQGTLAQLDGPAGCLRAPMSGFPIADCAAVRPLLEANDLVVSPDGEELYVASRGSESITDRGSNAVVTVDRDGATGALRYRECISDNGASGLPGTDGDCRDGDALRYASGIAMSADGRNVYVTAAVAEALVLLRRDPATGRLEPMGCFQDIVKEGRCRDATALGVPTDVAVSPDGRHVYVAALNSNAIVVFARGTDGEFAQASCISDDGRRRGLRRRRRAARAQRSSAECRRHVAVCGCCRRRKRDPHVPPRSFDRGIGSDSVPPRRRATWPLHRWPRAVGPRRRRGQPRRA